MVYSSPMGIHYQRKKSGLTVDPPYLILADNHPEIHAIVQEMSNQSIPFLLISNLVLKPSESQILLKVLGQFKLLRGWITRRTLKLQGENFKIIRVLVFLDVLVKLTNQIHFFTLSNYLNRIYKVCFKKRITKIIANFEGKIIIVSEAIEVDSKPDKELITIAFHGSPELVNQMIKQAKQLWTDWKNSEKYVTRTNNSIEYADQIIVLSNFSKTGFDSDSVFKNKVNVIPIGGINLNDNSEFFFHKRQEIRTFLYLGRLTLTKGLPVFIDAAKSFSGRANFKAAGNLVAPIPGWPNLTTAIPALSFEFGPSADQVRNLYRTSDFYVNPSYYEGFGIASIEAMSFGCIPILSKYSAAPEILSNSELEKYIFDPTVENSLKNVLNHILDLTDKELEVLSEISVMLSKKFTFESFAQTFVNRLRDHRD